MICSVGPVFAGTWLESYVADKQDIFCKLAASSYDDDSLPPERLDVVRRVMPTHRVKSSHGQVDLRRIASLARAIRADSERAVIFSHLISC